MNPGADRGVERKNVCHTLAQAGGAERRGGKSRKAENSKSRNHQIAKLELRKIGEIALGDVGTFNLPRLSAASNFVKMISESCFALVIGDCSDADTAQGKSAAMHRYIIPT
jgi:hypothetical protein